MTDDAGSRVARQPGNRRRWRFWLLLPLALVGAGLGILWWADAHVERASDGYLYGVDDVPDTAIAMVLGARAYPDAPSPFLAARLDLAIHLWERGAIRAVLVSGDGSAESNDEPSVMRDYLVEHGVPADRIVTDPAGFATYDSCVRARDVFGVDELIVLTQDFHLPRSVTLCRELGIDAVGVGDTTVRERYPAVYERNAGREWLANLKMHWYLLVRPSVQQDPFDPALLDAARR